ncbi:uncharacterized protein LOC143554134 [Bidens hawaiensis]|uniref:uncharacterized protein LOC143554134 n=1 Tax=Bidens hawaiensis TaxID=980011 RepID=UPI00404A1BFA
MSEEEKRCPLCAEEMDWTDQQLKPCKCGYEVCVWCWHHIMDMAEKDATEGRCPACRTAYDKDRSVGLESNFQRVAGNNTSRKQKQPKGKQKPTEVKKDLSNVRVIQRKMAYIIGLPLSLADEDLLQRKDYFGQYGKVTKVSLSRTAGGSVQQFVNDTCSVYITFAKEEDAVRCIQSVHGYVLDGRYLRASFGTAKYCHAWLRNMPCNNVACLYLHNIGAEEDSLGKDETAAVHTRNRVQEIVGATQYLHNRLGSMLPPPVDEHLHNRSAPAQEPVFSSTLRDVAYAAVASGDDLHCSKDKDGVIKSSKHMTSFVDIVGRSHSSGLDKDISLVSQGQIPSLCSDLFSVCINDKTGDSDIVSSKSSTYSEPFREASQPADPTLKDTNIIKEPSCSTLDKQKSLDSSYPVEAFKSYSDQAWWQTESSSQNGFGVNNYADETLIQSTCTKPGLNDGYDGNSFGSLTKADRIYRGSKSFSNEEIVEHLRRLDDDSRVDNDENSAAVESSIISNILSMDFDGCDNSVLPHSVTGLFERKDVGHSSWSFQNSDQSRFSFANEKGHSNQELGRFSVFQNSREIQDSVYKPQYQGSRAQNVIPPGFSKPPPGFPSSMRTQQVVSANSGSYVKNSLPNNRYHLPSTGDLSKTSDGFTDPSMMVVGRGKSSSFDAGSSSFDWLLTQQQSASAPHHHHEPQFSQTSFMQQHHTPQFPLRDNYYGDITSRLVDQHHQSYTQQQQYSQPKFTNGHITNGYQQQLHLDESQQVNSRNEAGGLHEQTQRNERLRMEKLLPGYGEFMHQMPSSGDVYTRVFGM